MTFAGIRLITISTIRIRAGIVMMVERIRGTAVALVTLVAVVVLAQEVMPAAVVRVRAVQVARTMVAEVDLGVRMMGAVMPAAVGLLQVVRATVAVRMTVVVVR